MPSLTSSGPRITTTKAMMITSKTNKPKKKATVLSATNWSNAMICAKQGIYATDYTVLLLLLFEGPELARKRTWNSGFGD